MTFQMPYQDIRYLDFPVVSSTPEEVEQILTTYADALVQTADIGERRPLWLDHTDRYSVNLENALPNGGRQLKCAICDVQMSDGAKGHLQSFAHKQKVFGRMRERFQGPPPPHVTRGLEAKPWVQVFEIGDIKLIFNHITGEMERRASGDLPRGEGVPEELEE